MTTYARENSLKPLVWSIAGPASVVLSVLLLVIKESPFYIDLSAVALIGLLIAWRFKVKGAVVSTALLSAVFAYDYFIEVDPIVLWDLGLGLSIAISFFITSLASQETLDAIQKAGSSAISEIASWEQKFTELLHSNKALEADLYVNKDRFLQLTDQLKSKIESSERAERLLKLAREELITQTALREKTTAQSLDLKRELSLIKEQLDQERLNLKAIQLGAENYTQRLQNELIEAKHTSDTRYSLVNKELVESEEKLRDLLGQFQEMSERLKALQSEKEELEKGLDEALKPTEVELQAPERGRYFGMYHQLQFQFLEKKEELFKARKENFELQQKFLESQRDYEEQFAFDKNNEIHTLTQSYKLLGESLLEKEREVEELEELVSSLIRKN